MKIPQNPLTRSVTIVLAALAIPFSAIANQSSPSPKKTVAPHLSSANRNATGDVSITVHINEYGFVTEAKIASSTNEALNQIALDAIHEWTFTPAQVDGKAVPSKAVQPFHFNHGSIVFAAKKLPQDRHPTAKRKKAPQIDATLKSITGEVVLAANIDSQGHVTSVLVNKSTHSELEASASAALANWTFKPAIKNGEKVASKIIVPFHFQGTGTATTVAHAVASKSVDKAPIALRRPTPTLTKALRNQRGEAKLKLTVDENGYVANVEIIESSNEALTTAAREAALQWKFKPAIKNGQAVASTVVQPFSFNGGLLMASLPVDKMPSIRSSKKPELPQALVGVQGYVSVRLNLNAQGRVLSAEATKASHDELITPTLEAALGWRFRPAVKDGEKAPASVVIPFVFNGNS